MYVFVTYFSLKKSFVPEQTVHELFIYDEKQAVNHVKDMCDLTC